MKIEEFWNQAFLACLSRLPPAEALEEANESTERCIRHWQDKLEKRGLSRTPFWKDQDIAHVPITGDEYRQRLRDQSSEVSAKPTSSNETPES